MANGWCERNVKRLGKAPEGIKLLAAIFAIIIAIISLGNILQKEDFEISLNPMIGTTSPGGELTPQITVSDNVVYDSVVSLAYANTPAGVHITIKPPLGDGKPTYTSNIIIKVDENVPLGQYIIEIIGTGQKKNLEHKTKFLLYVTEDGKPTEEFNITPIKPSVGFVDITQNFYASGWMGNLNDIILDQNYPRNYHSKFTCIKIDYLASGSNGNNWAGIFWQFPDNNWGEKPEGFDMAAFSKVTFWARGENGDEVAEFKVGGIDGKAAYPDTIQPPVSTGVITLTKDWQQYTIDLKGKDRSHVIGGFAWVAKKDQNPGGSTFYIDDMQFE